MQAKDLLKGTRWIAVFCIGIGALLRWLWIFPLHSSGSALDHMHRYVFSDMWNYWRNATLLWHPELDHWTAADAMWPLGMPLYLAALLGRNLDLVIVFQSAQWILSIAILVLVYALADEMYGKRTALIALAISSVTFGLFDYSAYALAETPFTVLLLAFLILIHRAHEKGSLGLFALAGLTIGLAAIFKAVGFLVALVFVIWLLGRNATPFKKRLKCVTVFFACALTIILTESAFLTAKNGGEPVLISNDIARIALANHGDLFGVRVTLHDGSVGEIRLPTAFARKLTVFREVSPESHVVLENLAWVSEHPAQAATGLLRRIYDLFFDIHPFPTAFTPYRVFVAVTQILTALFVLFPAGGTLLGLWWKKSPKERGSERFLLLPVAALLLTTIIAASEPRYLHSFLPVFILLAARFYLKILSPKAGD